LLTQDGDAANGDLGWGHAAAGLARCPQVRECSGRCLEADHGGVRARDALRATQLDDLPPGWPVSALLLLLLRGSFHIFAMTARRAIVHQSHNKYAQLISVRVVRSPMHTSTGASSLERDCVPVQDSGAECAMRDGRQVCRTLFLSLASSSSHARAVSRSRRCLMKMRSNGRLPASVVVICGPDHKLNVSVQLQMKRQQDTTTPSVPSRCAEVFPDSSCRPAACLAGRQCRNHESSMVDCAHSGLLRLQQMHKQCLDECRHMPKASCTFWL